MMSDKKILLVILLATILSFEFIDGYWPKKSKISTHPQTDKAGKWSHYFRAHPLGKMYHLYHNTQGVGLILEDYSTKEQQPVALYKKRKRKFKYS